MTAPKLPVEPLSKIITSLADLTTLNTLEQRGLCEDWIRREPVMQAVLTIRDAAFALRSQLTSALALAAEREGEIARINGALDFDPDDQHTIADMANVGFSLMEAIKDCAGKYCYNESPAEIVCDLINERDEANARLSRLPADWEVDSSLKTWFPITAEQMEAANARLDEQKGEIELINGQLRYVMKSNETNFNRAEAANARAEAMAKDATRWAQSIKDGEFPVRHAGQWLYVSRVTGKIFIEDTPEQVIDAAIDAMVKS